jgi:hypothetical protein
MRVKNRKPHGLGGRKTCAPRKFGISFRYEMPETRHDETHPPPAPDPIPDRS